MFWRAWPAAVRGLLVVAFLAFGSALLLSVLAYFGGDDATQPWQTLTDLAETPVPVDTVAVGTLRLPVLGTGFALTQTLMPDLPHVNQAAAWWALAGLTVALIGYLTILPGLGWRTFLVGTGGLIFFLSCFNLDLLGLLPVGGPLAQGALVVALVVLGGTAYALQAFFPRVGPTWRLLLFSGLVLGLGAIVFGRSALSAADTAQHLVSYGLSGALVASALFVLFISYENIRALLWLTGQGQSPAQRRSQTEFLIACGLYLLNLLLVFLDTFGFVRLGGAFLNAFFVLLSSIISGLVGLRLREAEYGRVIPYLLMLPLYLLLGTLTLGTLGYGFATANDPLIEAFTDVVVTTHLAAGAAFVIYLIVNFSPLLQRRLRVYRVVFDPKQFPLYTVYIITAVALASMLLHDQLFLFRQASGGYYNALGDCYRATGATDLADRYYHESDRAVPFNVKANLSRAALASERSERQREEGLLRQALRRNPTEKAYARLAGLFNGEGDFFSRQEVLRAGLKRFPESATLNLLMGTLYTRSAINDSVQFYFNRAERHTSARVLSVLLTNRLADAIRHGRQTDLVVLTRALRAGDAPAARANALLAGLLTGRGRGTAPGRPAVGDSLTPETFGYLAVHALRQAADHDTASAPLLAWLANRPANLVYAADLLETRALVLRNGGEFERARGLLVERAAAGEGEVAGRRFRTLGQWALQDGQPVQAVTYLTRATERGDQPAFLYRVMALALAGQTDSARRAIPVLYTSADPLLIRQARYLELVLNVPATALADDTLRADFVALRHVTEPGSLTEAVLGSIRRTGLRASTLAIVAEQALATGDVARADRLLQTVPPSAVARNPALRLLSMEVLIRQGQKARVAQPITHPDTLTDPHLRGYRQYLTALYYDAGRQTRDATHAFATLPHRAPWLTRGVVDAAGFFAQHPPKTDPLAAYNILLGAVRYDEASAVRWQAYALECARQGFSDFGADALATLRTLLSPADYAAFQTRYETLRATTRANDSF